VDTSSSEVQRNAPPTDLAPKWADATPRWVDAVVGLDDRGTFNEDRTVSDGRWDASGDGRNWLQTST